MEAVGTSISVDGIGPAGTKGAFMNGEIYIYIYMYQLINIYIDIISAGCSCSNYQAWSCRH